MAESTFDAAKSPAFNIQNTKKIYNLPMTFVAGSAIWEKYTMRKCIGVRHRRGGIRPLGEENCPMARRGNGHSVGLWYPYDPAQYRAGKPFVLKFLLYTI